MHRTTQTRIVEVYLALCMIGIGLLFAMPGDAMGYAQYGLLRKWVAVFPGSEDRFGWLLMVAGAVRIGAIIVNGRCRPTPAIRIAGCAIGALLWITLTLSMSENWPLPAFTAFPFFAIGFETYCSMLASGDAWRMDTFGFKRKKIVKKQTGERQGKDGHVRSDVRPA